MNSTYMLAVVFSAIDKMTGPAKKIYDFVKDYEKMISKGKGLHEAGKQMGITAMVVKNNADKMIGALESIMQPTVAINDEMASLETVTTSTMGSMTKSMAASRKAALQWSKQYHDSAATFVNTSTIIAGAGLNDIQAIAGTRVALALATATFGEAGEAAELMGVLYNNMGDKTKNVRREMEKLGDVVTVTQQLFQIKNMSQLSEGYKYAVPAALQYKISIQEVSAALGMLNTTGLAGSQAGTAFNATMRQMIKASKELGFAVAKNADGGVSFIKTIENIRKKYGEFGDMSDTTKMAFQDAFGDEGLRAISLLLGKTNELNDALISVTKSSGATAKSQKLIEMKSPSLQYQIMKNNINAVKDTLSVALLPTINQMLPKVIQLIDGFGKFVEKHPGLVKIVMTLFAITAAVLSILVPILTMVSSFKMMAGGTMMGIGYMVKGFMWFRTAVIGGAVPAIWSFTAALLACPITWIILAVIALAAGVYLLIRNWSKVKTFFINLWTGIMNIWNKLHGWVKVLILIFLPFIAIPIMIAKHWSKIIGFFRSIWNGIINIFGKLPGWVKILMTIFMPFIAIPLLIITNWSKIKSFFVWLWNGIVNIFKIAFNWIKQNFGWISYLFGPFIGITITIIKNWTVIKNFFVGLWNGIVHGVKTAVAWLDSLDIIVPKLLNSFKELAKQAWNWGGNLISMFIEGIKNKVSTLKKGLYDIADQIKNFLGFHSPTKYGPGADANVWAPNLMQMYQKGIYSGIPGIKKAALATALGVSMGLNGAAATQDIRFNNSGGQGQQLVVNFNGPVTIMANNPNDLWTQLKTLAEEVS